MSTTTTTQPTTTSSSPSKATLLSEISSLVPSHEIISPSSPDHLDNTQTWSHEHNLNPILTLRPTTIESLSTIVSFLGRHTELDFKVRSQGFGNASARDVLVSLTAFDEFTWNERDKTVTLGAGASWSKYYENMHVMGPYAIVSARTPSIGVGGSTLASGFSWLSHEYGCVSDANNMVDAEVVKVDGSVVWASSEPDLLWALRGTETGFGVVTRFVFKAFPYPQNGKIYAGPIFIPRNKIEEAADGIAKMVDQDINSERGIDPKVSMFLYVMRKEILHLIGVDQGQDVLVIHCFDANGEEHGRKTFKWALDIEGANDQTRGGMNLKDVADLQAHIGSFRGAATTYWTPLALPSPLLTKPTILNAVEWWTSLLTITLPSLNSGPLSTPSTIPNNAWLLLELFSCRDALAGPCSSAWPRPKGYKQMILLGAGADKSASQEELALARQRVIDGPKDILGRGIEEFKEGELGIAPNAVMEFHDMKRNYQEGGHWERLCGIKGVYDPENRLGGFFPPTTRGMA